MSVQAKDTMALPSLLPLLLLQLPLSPPPVLIANESPSQQNFTAIMGGFGAKTPAAVEAQLKAAKDYGLGVVAAGAAGINDYGGAVRP